MMNTLAMWQLKQALLTCFFLLLFVIGSSTIGWPFFISNDWNTKSFLVFCCMLKKKKRKVKRRKKVGEEKKGTLLKKGKVVVNERNVTKGIVHYYFVGCSFVGCGLSMKEMIMEIVRYCLLGMLNIYRCVFFIICYLLYNIDGIPL